MGDAGPLTPHPVYDDEKTFNPASLSSPTTSRDINVLVTGFGPFKSFTSNPSYLITSALPACIDQSSMPTKWNSTSVRQPVAKPDSRPYNINLHTHPTPVRVAYSSTATAIPRLIAWRRDGAQAEHSSPPDNADRHLNYDYIFHIGMAGGREYYSLETNAHRDHYKIKDIEDRDGFMAGEYVWKQEALPERFDVGWDKEETLSRWEHLTQKAEDDYEEIQMANMGFVKAPGNAAGEVQTNDKYRSLSMIGKGRRAVVKLSHDAGRFLCEFILYTSLSTRYKEAKRHETGVQGGQALSQQLDARQGEGLDDDPAQRIGKVAFLHVPGGVGEYDIARGVRVAKAAIVALVSSWEDGYRNKDVHLHT